MTWNVDVDRLIIAELYLAEEINLRPWVQTAGQIYTFQTAISDLNFSEISSIREIKENGSSYAAKSSIAEVEATASSYYVDYNNKQLYVHTSTGESPSTQVSSEYKFCILMFFWMGLASGLREDGESAFPIQGNSSNVFYQPIIKEPPELTLAVGEYHSGAMRADMGELKLVPSQWLLLALKKWIFEGKEIIVKVAKPGDSYSSLQIVSRGYIKNISKKEDGISLEIEDRRNIELGDIPPQTFSLLTYPNMEARYDGQPIPIPFGQVENIIPILINSSTRRYKVSPYAIDSFLWVKKDGNLLTPEVDYTAYPDSGEFTLAADPGNSLITCGVKGIKISYFGGTAAFSENVANVLYFILTTLCGIDSSNLDQSSFNALQSARTQQLSWWFAPSQKQPATEAIRRMMATFLFHLVARPDGKYYVKYFEPGETGSTEFKTEDIIKLDDFREDYDSIYSSVVILYDFNPQTGEWKRIEKSDPKTEYRYKKKNSLVIESLLRDSAEAEALAEKYLKMYRNPVRRLNLSLQPLAYDLKPADKIKISKLIYPEGTPLYLLENAVYIILESRINFANPFAEIQAIDLSQAAGAVHSDVVHKDSHGDSHSDVAHGDVAHGDETYNDYNDTPHSDSHSDSHSDQAHQDIPHEDSHEDSAHLDYTHSDHDDHYDDPLYDDWNDYVHDDVAHTDSYADSHTDSPHLDSHEDSYSDVAHEDVSHTDYSDSPHSDTSHEDSHSDSHSDTPHIDSWY